MQIYKVLESADSTSKGHCKKIERATNDAGQQPHNLELLNEFPERLKDIARNSFDSNLSQGRITRTSAVLGAASERGRAERRADTKGIHKERLIEPTEKRKSNLDWWHQAMSIFQKLFGSKAKDDALANCNLAMARDEIIGLHNLMNTEAASKGGKHLFSKEYATAWITFRDNPTIDNARALLQVAPPLAIYFESCSPGGSTYLTTNYLRNHGLK